MIKFNVKNVFTEGFHEFSKCSYKKTCTCHFEVRFDWRVLCHSVSGYPLKKKTNVTSDKRKFLNCVLIFRNPKELSFRSDIQSDFQISKNKLIFCPVKRASKITNLLYFLRFWRTVIK